MRRVRTSHLPIAARSVDRCVWRPAGPVVVALGIVAVLLSTSLLPSDARAAARCATEQDVVARALLAEARTSEDPLERAILLKRSLKVCDTVETWYELGRAELDLENPADASYAFENGRDVLTPDANGRFGAAELEVQALGSAWLAESYRLDGELALASVAVQEARAGFEALGRPMPARLLEQQAAIDDALAEADESVLARSLTLQQERVTRGIGVRPVVREQPDPPEVAALATSLQQRYTGADSGASSAATESAPAPSATTTATAAPQSEQSEARLNIPVLFDFDSAVLAPASEATVARLGRAIGQLGLGAGDRVRIVGHTDRQGDAAYNQGLSERRAAAVLERLRAMASNEATFESIGRGEAELRYAGDGPDDHRRNRRVEVVIVR